MLTAAAPVPAGPLGAAEVPETGAVVTRVPGTVDKTVELVKRPVELPTTGGPVTSGTDGATGGAETDGTTGGTSGTPLLTTGGMLGMTTVDGTAGLVAGTVISGMDGLAGVVAGGACN